MRILSIEPEPLHVISYRNAAPRGGVVIDHLPLLLGTVDALPGELAALLVTSDLQGVAPGRCAGGALVLLGEALAEEMWELEESGQVPPLSHTGVLLAGDLYSAPAGDKRGATGDVRSVWRAMAQRHRWVAGVAGNHDLFGSPSESWNFTTDSSHCLLDGSVKALDGLRVGGVGGIIGNPRKTGRRDESTYYAVLERVLDATPDVLVLHEGPDDPTAGQPGNSEIRELIESARDDLLIVCGHAHWELPLAALRSGCQVLNVDARAVLLRPVA